MIVYFSQNFSIMFFRILSFLKKKRFEKAILLRAQGYGMIINEGVMIIILNI